MNCIWIFSDEIHFTCNYVNVKIFSSSLFTSFWIRFSHFALTYSLGGFCKENKIEIVNKF